MVRHVTMPALDEVGLYDTLSSARSISTAARLASLRPHVMAAYALYERSANLAAAVPVTLTDAADGDYLRGNYDLLRTGRCRDIGSDILKRSRTCCLCGDRPSDQLDHHLPKKRFPEFAALTLNLVPVCAQCNHNKRVDYRRADGGPAFLHAYRDALPVHEQFLIATVHIAATVRVDFTVMQTPSMPPSVFQTLTSHFTLLDLAGLYGDKSVEVLIEKRLVFFESYASDGADGVSMYLDREARSAQEALGRNHWKPVLLRALADDAAFCDRGFEVLGDPGI